MTSVPNAAGQTWLETLTNLRGQMPKATFAQWLEGTRVESVEGTRWRIVAGSEFGRAWLQGRLRATVERTLAGVVGGPVEVEFIVPPNGHSPKPSAVPPPPPAPDFTPEPKSGEIDFGLAFAAETDFYQAKKKMGFWLPEFDYDRHFWSVYLGPAAYDFWRLLVAHWLKSNRDKRRQDLSRPANQGWTPPFRLSYAGMTKHLGRSNAKLIPGGLYECHLSQQRHLMREFDVPLLAECCRAYQPADWQPQPDGGGRCHYWRPGLLHALHEESLLAVEISPTGRARAQVLRVLPLLTPWQVETGLPAYLHEAHEKWLETFVGHFGLDTSSWERISQRRLAPFVRPGDVVLAGQPPANPLLGEAGDAA